jgi:hypothetical protein
VPNCCCDARPCLDKAKHLHCDVITQPGKVGLDEICGKSLLVQIKQFHFFYFLFYQ